MDSKELILRRIRSAAVTPALHKRVPVEKRPASLEAFVERVEDYRATVYRTTRNDIESLLATLCENKQCLTPEQFDFFIFPAQSDKDYSHADLALFDTTITMCAVGIEESGTIVLDSGPDQGRRAITLIPDHHICIIRADQIVATLEEALQRLDPTRPLTFISGPSATSDIELVRVEGVHGPRKLEVILLED
ncbi:MAG: lactate utilization protein C [Armatimonadota bacterium]